MILTVSTQHPRAGEMGFLFHKHPAKLQGFNSSFGKVHVFYPVNESDRCELALLLDVDPIGLVRKKGPGATSGALDQYVNDRPYVASSFLSVAIAEVLGSALNGRSAERPDLVEVAFPFVVKLAALPCRGGEVLLRKLFEPLGYKVTTERQPLDPNFPEWGESIYYTVELEGTTRLQDLLNHLYVLIPVLDDEKHYWVGKDEIEKLMRRGDGWLAQHPERETIVTRYLKYQKHLTREALAQLLEDSAIDPDETELAHAQEEEKVEEKISLNEQRLGAVLAAIKASGATHILDLGCGEGKLLRLLLEEKSFTEIVGMDVSYRGLEIAAERLHLDRMPEMKRKRLQLIHGSLSYRDARLVGFDAAAVVEVIEHLDPPRLHAFERVLFEFAKPKTIVITTPNAEYNVKFENLPAGKFRHKDHRFEWTREQFQSWAGGVAERFGYSVQFLPIGPEDATVGSPTQMGVFASA
ncbi:MAG: 3' terminal RNA ribose 2'-O-methyltransferase Hen1 [bacterium]